MSPIFKHWIIANSIGETLGLAGAALISSIAFGAMPESVEPFHLLLFFLLVALAGLIEGGLLGHFQAKTLRHIFDQIPTSIWTMRTMLAGAICWILGASPFVYFSLFVGAEAVIVQEPSIWMLLLFSALSGLILGGIIGYVQGGLLKKQGVSRWSWGLSSALGWLIGVSIIFLFASLPNEGSSVIAIILLAVLAGLLAGAAVAVTTWYFCLSKYVHPSFTKTNMI